MGLMLGLVISSFRTLIIRTKSLVNLRVGWKDELFLSRVGLEANTALSMRPYVLNMLIRIKTLQ